MTLLERAEIRRLPKKYRPMGAWGYFWYSILFALPIIGWISLVVCAVSDKSITRRSFARSVLLSVLVAVIVLAALVGTFAVLIGLKIIPTDFIQFKITWQ